MVAEPVNVLGWWRSWWKFQIRVNKTLNMTHACLSLCMV